MKRLRVVCVVLMLVGCALAQNRVAPAGGCTTVADKLLSGDVDTVTDTSGWQARAPMPTSPSGKKVKAGGWLAYDDSMKLVYGARGNKTGDFYAYITSGDSWYPRAFIPLGSEGKLPKDGAAGFSDGNGVLYATKGNNTLGFWKYDATTDVWTQEADVPFGPSGKKVRGGTDLVVTDSGGVKYVYLLKGFRNEFYKYSPIANTWQQMPDAPIGAHIKWDKGSWLAYDLQHTIFAHKARFHEFYSFNTLTDSWNSTPLRGMPLVGSVGSSKKSKDGGCATYHNTAVYALKGGDTQEFWKYIIAADSWTELEMVPRGTPRPKKVGSGADITTMPPASDRPGVPAEFPALSGNNSNGFWIYHSPGDGPRMGSAPNRDGVAADRRLDEPFLTFTPNPLSGRFVTLRYSLPGSGPAMARVYNVAGCPVLPAAPIANRDGTALLDLRSLNAGVYLLAVEGSGFTTVRKLVIDR
ncbi:MAG: T9SS type A sorting domain-containing protein [candidate division WOR-3 bacterium]|nr:T9SS type A sorting domain-containing protein [candidate division WOR-3 bacterium]